MKTPLKCVLCVLPLVLAGCIHKNEQAQNQPLAPPVIDTPPPAPVPSPTDLPPPVVTTPPAEKPQVQEQPPAPPAQKPARRPARRAKPETKPAEQTANSVPAVAAIGQLTPGDSSDLRSQTEQSIQSVEQGLKGVTRGLSDQEQKTVAQIREFIKQARAALGSGDVDGAHTLALKAKVLLSEIKP